MKRKSRLYGLEIDSRSVSYGTVDLGRATEIFIREGLVNDTITWPFPFLAHNRRVRAELESVLTRLRSVGYLGLGEAVYRYYAERITAVSAVPELVRLVRDRQAKDPRFLLMEPGDLVGPVDEAPPDHHFPAAVPIENRAIPLQYAYRPGHADDGVTLTVKLGELAALTPADVDWAVPGHLAERVEHYLRALPKEQRRLFVPMADRARELAAALAAGRAARRRDETVTEALAARIQADHQVIVDPAGWAAKPPPERLQVRVRVVDDAGGELAAGRDLAAVRAALEERDRTGAVRLQREDPQAWGRARERFEKGPQAGWAFGDIPDRVVVTEKLGVCTYGYPGLHAEEKGVALRLFRTPDEAAAAHRLGLAALFTLDLREDAYACISTWLVGRPMSPASEAAFTAAVARARDDLKGLIPRFVDLVGQITRLRQDLLVEKQPYPGLAADIERLVPADFLRVTPYGQLAHFPRYLKAMALRCSKRRQNPARDDERARELAPFAAAADRHGQAFRWLVEEFRVSLFAQELGTAVPVSKVKLERAREAPPEPSPGPVPDQPAAPPRLVPISKDRPAKFKNLKALDNLFPR